MNESDRPTALGPAHPDDLAASGPDPLIGTTLADTYKIERSVAEGGMGRVYEAHHTRISTKRFAIKVLHADLKHSLEVRMRFRREAEVAASVDHPSVVNVIDFGYTPDGRPYLVSDFLDGRELGALLDTGELLPVHIVVSITRQLCRALEAAHARGVVHRDLKPANVFLVGDQNDPMVKVLDFGLSRIAELAETSVTKSGIIMGTPSFMSPEQARGERVDHRADIYGIGAILYACITGRAPHAEDSPHATVLAVMNRDPVRPTSIIPNLPPELEVIIERAMARDPAERYQTTRDLDQALERFEERFAGPRMPSSPPPSMLGAPRGSIADEAEANGVRRRAAFWLVLAGLLVLGGSLSAALGAFAIFAPGRELSPTELLLVSLAVFGSLFTPGVLFVRWLANRYWSSTARMMTLVVAIRGPVVAATSAYGIVTLAGRVLDAALPRVTKTITAPDASGWSGWSPFIAGVALAAAIGAMIQHRLLVQGASWARRALAGTLAALTIGIGGAAVLLVGYRLHEKAPAQIAAAGPSTPIKREELHAPAGTGEPVTTARPVHTAQPEGPEGDSDARASKAELDEATASGAEALTALSSTYPKDPAVLRALALALAKDKDRTSELLRVVDALFSVEPKSTEDAEIAALVKDAALKVSTSARAIEMMQTRMGQIGADMLFDIVLNQPDFRERARVAFETSEVQRNLSPALRVAYDLYTAPTCSA
ncbi:MAG TPA: serine/threonine-protein kinase, partial [Polyangiaceae bacterium]|nr:serine/threonine-protein kinase [Polyangiaceae bacterium]